MPEHQQKKEGLGSGALLLAFVVTALVVAVGWIITHMPTAEDQKANIANTTAMELIKQGRITDAEKTLEPFVTSQESSAISCKRTLAALYAARGSIADAERVCRSLGGNTDAGTADTMHLLGAPMVTSSPKMARQILERSAEMYKTLYGNESPNYSKDLYNIAVCDAAMQNYQLAADEFEKCIPLLRQGHGADGDITAAAVTNLAACKQAMSTTNPQIRWTDPQK